MWYVYEGCVRFRRHFSLAENVIAGSSSHGSPYTPLFSLALAKIGHMSTVTEALERILSYQGSFLFDISIKFKLLRVHAVMRKPHFRRTKPGNRQHWNIHERMLTPVAVDMCLESLENLLQWGSFPAQASILSSYHQDDLTS